jgi:hypothetical protein
LRRTNGTFMHSQLRGMQRVCSLRRHDLNLGGMCHVWRRCGGG